MDQRRLNLEIREMHRVLPAFRLYGYSSCSRSDWHRYAWSGRAPSGHRLEARYPRNYPHVQLEIRVTPDVQTRHKINGGCLCVMGSYEWSPDYTAATNITIAFRFLAERARGTTER